MPELDSTLQKMKTLGLFDQLVFYLETCESGSMFTNLTTDGSIYAVTASNATQSSYAAYCGSDATVDGKSIGTCLSDLFATNWMTDTTNADISIETLSTQYDVVMGLTELSPVLKFGDESFISEPIGDFQGTYDIDATITQTLLDKVNYYQKKLT